ncbi:unnamed protein product, partial [marine sediment metagenome]
RRNGRSWSGARAVILPAKLIKLMKAAMKSGKYLVMVHAIQKDGKPLYGYRAKNFPTAHVTDLVNKNLALFWDREKERKAESTETSPPMASTQGDP